jgi:hypothetical protein
MMLEVHTELTATYKLSSFHPQNRRDEQRTFLGARECSCGITLLNNGEDYQQGMI